MKTSGLICALDIQPMCPGEECEMDGIGRSVAQPRADKTIGFIWGATNKEAHNSLPDSLCS